MSLYLLGVINNQLKEFPTSTQYLLKYLELTVANPSDPFAPIANFLIGSNNFQLLEKEVAPIKNDPEEKQKATKIAAVAKKHENIQSYLAKAIQLKPELEPAYMQLGNYYYYCQDLEKAIRTYKTLIEKFTASPDIASYKKFLQGIEKQKKQLEKK
jgi:tetratricopeptide (TPR) repeat protein